MSKIRRAVIFSTGQRYLAMVVNFGTMVIVSRLLTPAEIGVSAAATAIIAIAYSVREFATADFLVAQKELTRAHVRTAFTVMLLLTIAISSVLLLSARWIAAAYNESGLSPYIRLVAISILFQIFVAPIITLLRREMAFDRVAMIDMTNAAVNAAVTISLASIGFGYMSFAWGLLSAAVASAVLALYVRPDIWIFRPLLHEWRAMLRFGGYHGTNVVLYQLFDSLPVLLLGRLISFDALGLFNRAMNVSRLPDKVFFGGVIPVVLPAFSAQFREQPDLKRSYLRAVEYITGIQWPALCVLSILAYPVVLILLGAQWVGVASLVQIIALGWMFSFAFELNYPLLQSIDALRDTLLRALIAWPVSAVIIIVAVFFGLTAVALSYWITIPLQAFIAFHFVRRHINFSWRELLGAMQKSAIVTITSAAGPLAVVALSRVYFDISVTQAIIAAPLSVMGWLGGLLITKHPLLSEIPVLIHALQRFAGKSAFWLR
jgi:O-antigen/teichoic acid export membrane protein